MNATRGRGPVQTRPKLPARSSAGALAELAELLPKGKGRKRVELQTGEVESACIYFGPDRLAEVKRKAQAAGQSLSSFVCGSVDANLAIAPALMVRLESLASLRGLTVAQTLEQIVKEATSV